MYRWDILNRLVRELGLLRYLEIGLATGECFHRIEAPEKVGVDPAPIGALRDDPRVRSLTSDAFFATYDGPSFDLVFIDGLHLADQVFRDIENSLRVLSRRGVIVCHDMDPKREEHQLPSVQPGDWTGDCWKALCWLRQDRTDLDVFTLDTDWGCAIISRRIPDLPKMDPEALTWQFFQTHRSALLNLHPPDYLNGWIARRA